jgi:hypothetical protein
MITSIRHMRLLTRAASARGTLREAEKTAHRTGAARSPEEDDAATTCA